MKILLAFLFGLSALFANVATTESDPSALINGMVSAITGDLFVLEEDIIVAGAEPIRLKRSYVSSLGSFAFFENLHAYCIIGMDFFLVPESNGTSMAYVSNPSFEFV